MLLVPVPSVGDLSISKKEREARDGAARILSWRLRTEGLGAALIKSKGWFLASALLPFAPLRVGDLEMLDLDCLGT